MGVAAGKGAKIEDSNIANYGSKEHKDAKLNAAKAEAAWDGAGQAVGIEIWRIEKFQVVHWPKTKYGQFYSGDAYIILNSYKLPDRDDFRYNLHFWLGKSCSQDEQGTAAYKTVELDDLLGDVPVQYREVQGHESEEFLGCFGGKIITMEGGVASGFNHVKPKEYRPRLLQMKGRKLVHVSEVPTATASLNDGDVFLLDLGTAVVQWNGIKSGMFEKRKAVEIIAALREDRNGRVDVTVIDGLQDCKVFWETLGEAGGAVPASVAPPTEDPADSVQYPKKLFCLSDEGGSLEMKDVTTAQGKVLKSKLQPKDVFILDTGKTIMVWIGKVASKAEKANGVKYGVQYLQQNNRPLWTPVLMTPQGGEPDTFWQAFDA